MSNTQLDEKREMATDLISITKILMYLWNKMMPPGAANPRI